ncbi:hypothetical protein DVK85_09140 [Flavobacterium arcticum]|uniref:HTH luxR-type domain-containing protein n=1 Tax=Flavobacterium arcticum TaxID=1784713 RepID=A0A345HCS7_9FLAO|nr:hypothetical protein [Flavobacterium arcticum]AXG74387.1 hypothetical protein DVK85_09140 [Flavobacterium arcticum]KAF2507497.1 hypothetical protein E0W72_11505 [Flavobacterium arcticum]
MNTKKTVVIGSDNAANLITLLSSIQKFPYCDIQIISASRLVDLLSILIDSNPDLVIINFTNNQEVLNDINNNVKKLEIPILCLDPKSQPNILNWDSKAIVFVYPFEMIHKEHYIFNRINSIFLLKSKTYPKSEADRFPSLIPVKSAGELSRYVMELDKKREILSKVRSKIKALYPNVNDPVRKELMSIVNYIKATSSDKNLWGDFKFYFEQIHQDFLQQLTNKHPALTPTDLKYCCYLKMNMTNDDIKNLLGINQESVRTHTYRLKLKMALRKEEDLRYYLRSVC